MCHIVANEAQISDLAAIGMQAFILIEALWLQGLGSTWRIRAKYSIVVLVCLVSLSLPLDRS